MSRQVALRVVVGSGEIGPTGKVEWGIVPSNARHMRGQLPKGDGGVVFKFLLASLV